MQSRRATNLLFIYSDEQRFDTMACYGNARIEMPNLNRFAERATVFEKAYVTQPVCTPSRGSLLTGLTPHRHGCTSNNIPLRAQTRCLPEMLVGNYRCAHHGKWHLGDEIYAQHGFTEWMGTEDTYHRYYSAAHEEFADRSAYHHWLKARGVTPVPQSHGDPSRYENAHNVDRFFREQLHRLPEPVARPTFLAEQAERFLRENREKPFCLYVNAVEPHMPFHSCRDGQYGLSDVALPANAMCMPAEDTAQALRFAARKYRESGYGDIPRLATEADWRLLTSRYWGMCSLVDTMVGRILDALTANGLEDNTIVVFTSDHGDMMSSHQLMGKGVMYEEAVRVPLLVRLPGQAETRRVCEPVSQLDVVPTLLDCMGQRIPRELEGESLAPALRGETWTPRDVFIEWHGRAAEVPNKLPVWAADYGTPAELAESIGQSQRAVVTPDGWKFVWSSVGEHLLYDLHSDPGELCNLYGRREQAERVVDLCGRIRARQEQTGDAERVPAGAG